MKEYRSFTYYLGTFFMLFASAFLLYIYVPVTLFFLLPRPIPTIPTNGTFIYIPKINAFAPIVFNVDPWNEKEYQQKLTRGVAHAKGTSLPGEKGTTFLFAHSSDVPWRISRYNMVFFRLGDLRKNDQIALWENGRKIDYRVTQTKEVWPNEVTFLINKQKSDLILQTCTPIGTSLKRLLVFANKIKL